MTALRSILGRLAQIAQRSRFDRDLDAEIQFHLDARADELVAAGSTRDEAVAQARREFGSRLRAHESSGEAWRFGWFEDLRADVRYALRTFRRSPAFTITAVASLALGIGASSAMFAALDAILWKPLPVADPGGLVRVSLTRSVGEDTQQIPLSYAEQLRAAKICSDLILTSSDGLSFAYDGRAERIVGSVVSQNYFTTLGLRPALGRGFSNANGQWAAEAVLGYRFWQRRFNGEPSVIGRTIHINTYPFTIVGVSPESFFDLSRGFDPELRIPLLPAGQTLSQIEQASGAPSRRLSITARVNTSMTMAAAEAAADAQLREWLKVAPAALVRQQYAHTRLQPADAGIGDMAPFRAPMLVLAALVGRVLVIACANVASMLLARGIARHRELALRASIGAGRTRLVRQLLTESVLLAAAGGAIGIAIAFWIADALFWFLPQGHVGIAIDLRPDGRVLGFTSALSMLTGIVFGLAPALQASRRDLTIGLKSNAGAVGGVRTRSALVVAQVALSLVLLIVAGWFMRTVSNLRPLDYRVQTDRVLLFTMKPQREIYDAERMRRLVAELQRRMAAVRGVRSAALAEFGPLGSRGDHVTWESPSVSAVQGAVDLVTPGFFDTIGLPLVAGHDFGPGDTATSPRVIVINEAMSQALFRGASAIGRTIRVPEHPQKLTFTVVGVVANTRYYDLHEPVEPAGWIGVLQETPYMPTLHVRAATADVASVITTVRQEFDATDKGLPIFNIKTLDARIEDSLARERMVANISVTFGLLALLLAGVGLYGILAYTVSRRQREIGIRLALGSTSGAVMWGVAREAGMLVACGAIAGIALALGGGRLASPYLFGVSQFDPAVLLASTGALAIIAVAAVSVPAARATRVNPTTALRAE